MAVPPVSAPCWRKLANGALREIRTENLGTRLLIKRIEISKAPVDDKAREIHDYYVKWERGLGDEIAQFC